MKNAKELLLNYLEFADNADKVIELFADDAVAELPYLESIGLPWRAAGKKEIYQLFAELPAMFEGFKFKNINIYIETPEQAFGEYEAEGMASATGRPYHQHYMGRLVAENGKIKLLREAMNLAEVARSLFPNGINDLGK